LGSLLEFAMETAVDLCFRPPLLSDRAFIELFATVQSSLSRA
jgi:hypothetical protein